MSGLTAAHSYHTAGKGTRLAPLPGSENNNKPGVKLPSMLTVRTALLPPEQEKCQVAVPKGRALMELTFPPARQIDGDDAELTILEAVIKQTNSYAPHRKGRVSVFWGDQVFVPSAGTNPSGAHPADILALTVSKPFERSHPLCTSPYPPSLPQASSPLVSPAPLLP